VIILKTFLNTYNGAVGCIELAQNKSTWHVPTCHIAVWEVVELVRKHLFLTKLVVP
jgi:hypothetical protein